MNMFTECKSTIFCALLQKKLSDICLFGRKCVNLHRKQRKTGGLAQLARALAWHARGHRFEPDILHETRAEGGGPQGYPPFPFAPYMAPCSHPGSARLLFWKTWALISEDPGSYFGRPRLLFRKRQALILEDLGSYFGRPRLLFRKTQALVRDGMCCAGRLGEDLCCLFRGEEFFFTEYAGIVAKNT